MIGSRLGNYEIEARLGAGGMGVVYLAQDLTLGRRVALKLIGDKQAGKPRARARLLEEARAASSLSHPNVCTIYEVGELDGQSFIAMEYVEGRPLSEQIPDSGLPLEQILRYGAQIADGLAHAHDRGIIHRDLKSDNIVITPDGRAKILDFGLADVRQTLGEDEGDGAPVKATVSMSVRVVGTLHYMSPEALRGERADERSDVWSLGIILYEIAAGRCPFEGQTGYDIASATLRQSAPPLPKHVPPGLRSVISNCLAKEPGQRYQRAGEVRAALHAIQSSDSDIPPLTPALVDSPRRWVWAAPLLLAIIAAAVVLGYFARSDDEGGLIESLASRGRLELLLAPDGRISEPALSPDGSMLAYVGESGERRDLFVRRVAGGSPVRLTDDEAVESGPAFSPDGEQIAFGRRRAGMEEICLTPTLGGEIVPLVPGATEPTWSPEGTRLAFIRLEPGEAVALAIIDLDGSGLTTLLHGDADYPFLMGPAWSPDGSQIAVVRGRGGIAREVWLIPTRGGAPTLLTNDPVAVFSDEPVFTPDGRSVVHVSNRAGATNLWAKTVGDERPAVRLTTGAGRDVGPSVARSGAITFLNARFRTALSVFDLERGVSSNLLTHSRFIWAPTFSPDGKTIAFSRGDVDGAWSIWTVSSEGRDARRVSSGELPQIYPRFTPDGESLIYFTWSDERPDRVWLVPRVGGPPSPLTPERDGDDAYADVSPDGSRLAFTRTEGGESHVWVAPIAGGEPRKLTESVSALPHWSPDGQWIAFTKDRTMSGGIFAIRADGSDERRLTEVGGWPAWWPDGKRVGFLALGEDGSQQIRVVSLDGGPIVSLAEVRFEGSNHPFDVSPDGKRLVYSNTVPISQEIWLLRPAGANPSPAK